MIYNYILTFCFNKILSIKTRKADKLSAFLVKKN